MGNQNYAKIIEICRKNEGKDVNLWIKALKYFCDSS
jgi:hypothetical protein